MNNAVVLLSGGMDSSTALYWAIKQKHIKVVAAIHFTYGQLGSEWEFAAAGQVNIHASDKAGYPIPLHHVIIPMRQYSLLQWGNADLSPGRKDSHGNPSTFVPGRNLIQLAMALPILYVCDAHLIIGGWTQVDVDYPDCRRGFLESATITFGLALGEPIDIVYPFIDMAKKEIVELGTELEIPWRLTRSCYNADLPPCGMCDSCLLRVAAFDQNGMIDPAYHKLEEFKLAMAFALEQGYLS